tara:strand:+ start:2034 stop:2315 length:282 start_codon:yes stop_codon:yes gene_type:complete
MLKFEISLYEHNVLRERETRDFRSEIDCDKYVMENYDVNNWSYVKLKTDRITNNKRWQNSVSLLEIKRIPNLTEEERRMIDNLHKETRSLTND